ncbi:MAG TPA: MFS transporter [Phycisphaerae bacterium]|nr:MFS transporter [Phycisphaerae bacterium]
MTTLNSPLQQKEGLFTVNGKSLAVTFALVSSLFFLWAVGNGMIDVMDKHFQDELHLSKSQSAWVQFAHYLGYFLMSMPAGWLAGKLGYKGGIISGLMFVSLGGFWFLAATHIAQFWAFLLGVCVIASGFTFLETVANPYTTVLGPQKYAAARINLAQSANGVGWIFGPIIGSLYFYSKNAQGVSTGSQTLYIPYVTIACIVIVIAIIFAFAQVPDIKAEDDYAIDKADPSTEAVAERRINRGLIYVLMLLNAVVLTGACAMILWVILSTSGVSDATIARSLYFFGAFGVVLSAVLLVPANKKITHHSMWSHPHFSSATLAQFFYVAAQAGIFSFFVNSMTIDRNTGFCMVPAIPDWMNSTVDSIAHSLPIRILHLQDWMTGWFETRNGALAISDAGASALQSVGFVCFLLGRFTGAAMLKRFSAHKMLGIYALCNVFICFLILSNLGWTSVVCIFLSFFFMSIMFPTIFALGIFGLGAKAKRASSFIVMAIMGGAILPKLMGLIADKYNMAHGYVVPIFCFAIIAAYAFAWPMLSGSKSMHGVNAAGGH